MKTKKYLFMLATLFSAAIGFTACSSEDSVTGPNELDELGEPVRAQFTISIPATTGGATTRMAPGVVQNSITNVATDFRGINDINMFPSAVAEGDFGETSAIGKKIQLLNMLVPNYGAVNQEIPKGKLLGTSKSVLYGDVQLNIGTKTFLFYGKAIGRAESDVEDSYTSNDFFKYGWLSKTMPENAADVSGFKFTPKAILDGQLPADITSGETMRTTICTYLGQIANAQVSAADTWRESDNAGMKALFNSFVNMKAGSSANLQAAIKDLYFTCKDIYTANGSDLAKAIYEAIYNPSNSKNYVTVSETDLTFNSEISNYPSIIGLPDGAAILTHTTGSNGKISFAYATGPDNSGLNVTNTNLFAYPANLYYWGKSDILTSEESQQAYFTESMTWDKATGTGIFNHYDDENVAVTSNTRSVILKKKVQYGVGRLDFSVTSVGSATENKLGDNGKGSYFHAIDPTKIKLTGILIGGQKNVGWDFTQISGNEYTLYDNIVISQNATGGVALAAANATTFSPLAQTLVLETAGGDNDKVNVALEFINNDQDFYGASGIVPKGCKFYLVGSLEMTPTSTNGSTTTKPKNYAGHNKVFEQDYVTIATFKIKSLAAAENTIPDLRNPKVELGLSVDLTWQDGVIFDVYID